MEDVDLTNDDILSDKMEINLHMFDALMLNGVGGEVHDVDIVAVDKCALRRWALELMEQLAQAGGLRYVVGDDAVLSLCVGPRDYRLSLGALELMEQLVQASGLRYAIGDDAILSLRVGSGDDRLPLG
jgi:hypothetical protein